MLQYIAIAEGLQDIKDALKYGTSISYDFGDIQPVSWKEVYEEFTATTGD